MHNHILLIKFRHQ